YWVQPLSLTDKLARLLGTYLSGLSPEYWFTQSEILERHRMDGYGHLPLVLLPFMLIGIAICVRQFRSVTHRTILLAALVAPAPALLVDSLGFLRLAEFIVPAAVFSLLGLDF